MAVEYLDKGNDDGTCLGQSASHKISFFGATPVVQQATPVAVSTSTSTSTSYAWGFESQEQADAIVTAVNAIITKLTTLGLWA